MVIAREKAAGSSKTDGERRRPGRVPGVRREPQGTDAAVTRGEGRRGAV